MKLAFIGQAASEEKAFELYGYVHSRARGRQTLGHKIVQER